MDSPNSFLDVMKGHGLIISGTYSKASLQSDRGMTGLSIETKINIRGFKVIDQVRPGSQGSQFHEESLTIRLLCSLLSLGSV